MSKSSSTHRFVGFAAFSCCTSSFTAAVCCAWGAGATWGTLAVVVVVVAAVVAMPAWWPVWNLYIGMVEEGGGGGVFPGAEERIGRGLN